ncbi:uncharacterized protein LOC132205707 [Neocloeon triangulifer]|uniref:uncharacterized protein LOC132205707 n=1 Tax=Neocloeon triangulifer TaxID=2078957 RepID=UPI00286F3AD1|nr:uncharacterized protein LOC132205707 [Neocloeon triangulifer]XP_059490952.1 uncharacterized protein LOC132205707 [Neocloeon triangulifer]
MLEKKDSGPLCVASRSSEEQPGWLDSEGEESAGLLPCRLQLAHSVMPPEVVYFDETGDRCCISSSSNKSDPEPADDEPSNLILQEAGSQLMFPLEVTLQEEAAPGGGSLPELARVPSACSTLEEGKGAPPLVLGSAPAAPIAIGRGILHSSSSKINRKNSQVCFRDDWEVDSPLLPAAAAAQHHNLQPPAPVAEVEVPGEEEDEYELVPPDGGWGWLVLAGSVLVNILVPGTVKSFGVLFVEFLEVFHATPAAAAWIPALCYFLYSSLGPVASVLSAKFSYRTVTIMGGLFAAFGMILSYFASSITYLYVSFGVLVGTGAGLAFPPGVFIVSSYFQKRRGLANGICISGSAIGSIILPPFLRHLLTNYGYRGAVLIMGGITFNVLVGAMFYHPVKEHMKRVKKEKPEKAEKDLVATKVTQPVAIERSCSPQQVAASQPISIPAAGGDGQSCHPQMFYFEGSPEQETGDWMAAQSASFLGPSIDKASVENSPSPLALREVLEQQDGGGGKKLDWDFFSTLPPAKQRLLRLSLRPVQNQAVAAAIGTSNVQPTLSRSFSSNVSLSSFRYISTVHHGSTLAALQQNPRDNEMFASTLTLKSVTKSCWESFSDCLSCFRRKKSKKSEKPPIDDDKEGSADSTSKLLDLSLLKDSLYLVILLSNSTNAIGYTNFIILLPAYAISLGCDKESASLLLSLVAALDLVGRIGGSALSDLHFMPRKYYYIGGLFLSGLILTVMPLMAAAGFTYLAVACAIFGLGSGTYVGVTAVLFADMLGAERLASSFGISLFLNGVLQLLGPPVCGYVLQRLGNYSAIFSTLGVVLLIGAAMWGLIPLIERKRQRESEQATV